MSKFNKIKYLKEIQERQKSVFWLNYFVNILIYFVLFMLILIFFDKKYIYDFVFINVSTFIFLIIALFYSLLYEKNKLTYIYSFAIITSLYLAINFSGIVLKYFVINITIFNIFIHNIVYIIALVCCVIVIILVDSNYKKEVEKIFSQKFNYCINKTYDKQFDSIFSNKSKTCKLVLVTGEWGVGKTYQVKDIWMKRLVKNYEINCCDFIYMSFMDKNDFDSICGSILYKICGYLGNEFSLNYFESIINVFKLNYGIKLHVDKILLYFISKKYSNICSEKILVLDDLERIKNNNFNVEQMVLFLSQISCYFKTVILITNDLELEEGQKEYINKHFEKLFCTKITINRPSKEQILYCFNKTIRKEDFMNLFLNCIVNLRTANTISNFIYDNFNYKSRKMSEIDRCKMLVKIKLFIISYLYIIDGRFRKNEDISVIKNNNIFDDVTLKSWHNDIGEIKNSIENFSISEFLYEISNRSELFINILPKELKEYIQIAVDAIKDGNFNKIKNIDISFYTNPIKKLKFEYLIENVEDIITKSNELKNIINTQKYDNIDISCNFLTSILLCHQKSNIALYRIKDIIDFFIDIIVEEILNQTYYYENINFLLSIKSEKEVPKYTIDTILEKIENYVCDVKLFVNNSFDFVEFRRRYLIYRKYGIELYKCHNEKKYINFAKQVIDYYYKSGLNNLPIFNNLNYSKDVSWLREVHGNSKVYNEINEYVNKIELINNSK